MIKGLSNEQQTLFVLMLFYKYEARSVLWYIRKLSLALFAIWLPELRRKDVYK
jgi:hypothetical protein